MLPILLLHGALGAASQLQSLQSALSSLAEVHVLEFSSHGATEPASSFGIKGFAQEVLSYLDDQNIQTVNVFGYSMGGYVALYIARHYPDRIGRIVTLGTKLSWSPEIAAKEVGGLNPEKIRQKVPQFAETLQQRHTAVPWAELMDQTANMMLDMGERPPLSDDDFRSITTPVRLLLGDRDKMVSLDETLSVYRSLPNAQLGVLPGTPHPIEGADNSVLSLHISSFFTNPSH